MTTVSETVIRPPAPPGPVQWVRRNLFNSWFNAVLTVLALLVIVVVLRGALSWIFTQADWTPVVESLKLFAVGPYPSQELWRIWFIVYMASFLMGVSGGVFGGTVRRFALVIAAAFLVLAVLPLSLDNLPMATRLRCLVSPALVAAGYLLGRRPLLGRGPAIKRNWLAIAWVTSFVLSVFLLSGFQQGELRNITIVLVLANVIIDVIVLVVLLWRRRQSADISLLQQLRPLLVGWIVPLVPAVLLMLGLEGTSLLPPVESGLWGGLLLTFLLAVVGIVASFPIGVLLALGRQSRLPVVKGLCILFIEVVRGVPLVTILFMASIILPLFLPEQVRIDRVIRAMIGMTLFAAAYMAENVRGGLQSIPRGQHEAAKAMGLNGIQTTGLIILPQALRVVIPAIVGQFIALFMDTTLAIIVGLLELLAVGRAVLNSNPEWLLLDMEVYLFVAALFWVFTYSMSYASRQVEAAVGLGTR